MLHLLSSVLDKVGISLAAGLVMFVVGRLWKTLLRPSIENFWFRGTRLAPCYVGEFTLNGEKKSDIIDLNQKSDRVWGMMTFPEGVAGKYKFEGVIADNVLRGTFDGVRANPCTRGSFLLRLTPGSKILEGWFVEPCEAGVIALEYKWTPKPF